MKEEHYHLLFPCANSNLRGFWEKNPAPKFDKKTVLWSIRQMSGIASALDCIHSFRVEIDLDVEGGVRTPISGGKLSVKMGEEKYGRHGDIKPGNILYFEDGQLLKITDFGLGRFHGRDSRSGIDPRKVAHTLTYEPPECTIGRSVSRAYDIWSLACLFLEFVTWLLEGNEQIERFADERGKDEKIAVINDDNFFTIVTDEHRENEAEVRDSVVRWVARLRAHANCSGLIHELLDLVMSDMLQPHPDQRIKASVLKGKMAGLARRAGSDERFLVRGAPRQLPTPVSTPLSTPSSTPPVGPKRPSEKEVRWKDQQTSSAL